MAIRLGQECGKFHQSLRNAVTEAIVLLSRACNAPIHLRYGKLDAFVIEEAPDNVHSIDICWIVRYLICDANSFEESGWEEARAILSVSAFRNVFISVTKFLWN